MIQVIERASAILELVSTDSSKSWPMTEIADKLGINRSTCANILKTLVEVGFLGKNEEKKGYTLGYKLYKITGSSDQVSSMLESFFPFIEALASKVNESTILSTIRNGKRILIYQVPCGHELQVRAKRESSVYRTTTGRLQLAYYDKQKLDEFIRIAGMPGDEWPEVTSRKDMEKEFGRIRTEGILLTVNKNHVVGLASPIFHEGNVIASLGIYLPDSRFNLYSKRELEKALKETTTAINSLL